MLGAGSMKLMMEIHGRDLTGKAINSATANTKRLARNAKSDLSGMMNSVASYRKLVGSIVTAKVLSRGYALLERGIYNVGAAVVDTDQALTAASAKFGDVAARGTDGFSRMETLVKGIGGSTEFFASEAAQGLDFLAMAGFDYEQSLRAMVPLTDLATAAQMDLARASDIASDALGAFGLSTDAADIEASLGRVNDVFAETVTSSNTTMETLFDTMKHSGPAVVAAGGDIEMFATMAGKLGSAGIKATIAGTTLKNMFTRLIAPPSEARKALRKLNIDVDDGTGRMKDMISILGELNGAFEGRSEIAREKFIKDIFGMRAISGVNVLLAEGEDSLRAYNEQLTNSSGAAKEMADTMREGLGVQLKVLQSAFMQKGFEIFGGLMGEEDPAEAVAELSQVIREFDASEVVETLKTIGTIAKGTAEFLWENRDAIAAFAKIWVAGSLAARITGVATSVIGLGSALTGAGGLAASAGVAATGLGGVTAAAGAMATGLGVAVPLVTTLIASLTAGYEMWKALEGAQLEKEAAEQKYIKLTGDASGLDTAKARKESEGIMSYFASKSGPGGEAKYDNLLHGRIKEEDLSKVWGGEELYKAEALYALQRKLGKEATGEGWVNTYFRDQAATRLEREKAYAEYQAGGKSERIYDPTPWLNGGDQTRTHGVTEMADKSAWTPNSGQEVSDMSYMRYKPPSATPSINWDPEFKIKVDVNGLAPGQSATAEVTHVPSVNEASLGVPNG